MIKEQLEYAAYAMKKTIFIAQKQRKLKKIISLMEQKIIFVHLVKQKTMEVKLYTGMLQVQSHFCST